MVAKKARHGLMFAALLCVLFALVGCATQGGTADAPVAPVGDEKPKIGASFGVGAAPRWTSEAEVMELRAAELGADIEVRINKTDEPKTQYEDCVEMIDSGIDVLILIPRNANDVGDILDYAEQNNVAVIDYARAIAGRQVDLFVGYDSFRVGQMLGQYLSEIVYEGDYIFLKGDPNDTNAVLLYDGAMRYLDPLRDQVNVILDASVEGWSPEVAKQLVYDAVAANGNKVDAILAPNDSLAGACREALDELGVTAPVVITGMDADVTALQRIVAGEQSVTVSMDLSELATTAVDEAVHLAKGEPVNANADFENGTPEGLKSNLIVGKLITKENLDKILIESGTYTHEEIYG